MTDPGGQASSRGSTACLENAPPATVPSPAPPRKLLASPRLVALLILLGPGLFLLFNLFYALVLFQHPEQIFPLVKQCWHFNTALLPAFLLFSGLISLLLKRTHSIPRQPRLLHRLALTSLALGVFLIAVRIYAMHIEPWHLIVRTERIATPKISRPIRLLHISDIQSFCVGPYEKRVFEQIRRLEPDLIIHTGDLMQPVPPATPESERPKLEALFETLHPPLGMFHIMGDADHLPIWAKADGFGGLKIIESREVVIPVGTDRLRIYGLPLRESGWPDAAAKPIAAWMTRCPPGDLTILAGHRPDYILAARDWPIDLCLAGHTHGGQVRLPFIGPLYTASSVPRDLARGMHEVGLTRLNVSAGIGAEHHSNLPSLRLGCPPEMTLIELLPVENSGSPSKAP